MLTDPRVEATVTLADGREIGYAEFGVAGGPVVLWFHGTPGARRQVPPAARALADREGVRLIGVERPGVGASSGHLHESVAGWTDDVAQVADALDIERFGVIGLSGGGPYTLACASEFGDRVPAAVVLGGVAPTEGPDAPDGGLVRLAHRFRHALPTGRRPLGAALGTLARVARPIDGLLLDLYARLSPDGDQRAFRAPGMKAMFLDDLGRGVEGGGLQSVLNDVTLFTRHWGFEMGSIDVPVRLWHGDADNMVPLAHAEHMAERIPGATVTVRPEESHLGTLVVGDEAVQAVLDEW